MISFFKKKVCQKNNNELSTAKKITINVNNLEELLGGQNNIIGAEYTHTKIKIFLKSIKKVDVEVIKKIKNISGIFLSHQYITIIVGNQAKELANLLIKN